MAHIDGDEARGLEQARQQARQSGYVRHAQVMLLAAGLTAFGIVAVAAAMMISLF